MSTQRIILRRPLGPFSTANDISLHEWKAIDRGRRLRIVQSGLPASRESAREPRTQEEEEHNRVGNVCVHVCIYISIYIYIYIQMSTLKEADGSQRE